MKKVILKKKGKTRAELGHQWIFSNEIKEAVGNPEAGDVVEIYKGRGEFLGLGFFNPHSLISIRLLCSEKREIDSSFFKERIELARALRNSIYPNLASYRVVFGESDFMPGLILDKFEDFLCLQTLSAGADRLIGTVADAADEIFRPRGIIERNESAARQLEGLPPRSGILRGCAPTALYIEEWGLHYGVELLEGQKTGFYFDQRENRGSIRKYAAGGRVLDCFSYEGAFALNAAAAGAIDVIGVEISPRAAASAGANARLNDLQGRCRFIEADAFSELKRFADAHEKFDLVILDPPSFAKTKRSIPSAKKGYLKLNRLAMDVIREGGFLATASCSGHLRDEIFVEVILRAAREAGRALRLVEWGIQAPDHPILPAMPETKYLKFAVFSVT